ncbi:MAG: MBL fold metallo-hydrolase, partial [Parachlamydiaceae bacterium]
TDPIYSKWASPFPFIGPKRHHDPGIAFDNLPPIDYVLISHNHYDHMDLPTLKALQDKFNPIFVTGLGNDEYLKGEGIDSVIALDWWENYRGFTFVPAEHFSARWWFDRNRTLWGGFLIHHAGEYIYFAGDTAFGSHFNAISSKYGTPKVSFLPIGAYEPRWFMQTNHLDPIEALEAHRLLGSKTSIGMHFLTFQMADESRDAPLELLSRERTTERFITLEPGQSIDVHELERGE